MKPRSIFAAVICLIMLLSLASCAQETDDFQKGGSTMLYTTTKKNNSIIQRDDEDPNHIVDPNNRFKSDDFGPLMPMDTVESTTQPEGTDQGSDPVPDPE